METKIKAAEVADLAGTQHIFRRVISTHYRPFLGEENVNLFIWNGLADQYIEDHLSDTTVIIMDETIIGIAIVEEHQLLKFMIEPSFHRMGFGTRLLAHCAQKMFQVHNKLTLESFAENKKASQFFQKYGWSKKETKLDQSSGSQVCTFMIEKAPAN